MRIFGSNGYDGRKVAAWTMAVVAGCLIAAGADHQWGVTGALIAGGIWLGILAVAAHPDDSAH